MPPVWDRIEREVPAFAAAFDAICNAPPYGRNEAYERFNHQWRAAAKEIARQYGRDALIPLGTGYVERRDRLFREERSGELRFTSSFARGVVTMVVHDGGHDPGPMAGGVDLIAAAAIDLYQDEWARDALLELSLHGNITASGLLRAYAADRVRPKVEVALAELESRGEENIPTTAAQTAALRSLLASYDYAEGLDEATREQYQSFERRLWRSWAAAQRAPSGTPIANIPWSHAAWMMRVGRGTFVPEWQEGDERFVLRIFEEPTSIWMELKIAAHLAHLAPKLTPEARQRLAEIADSDSPHAQYARQALQDAAHRSNSP